MKVKPFYIRITDDMTPQMVQDAFDKCVDVGAVGCEGIDGTVKKHKYQGCYDIDFNNFGVNKYNETLLHDGSRPYGGHEKEITLDQLDEWLGINQTETPEEKEAFDSMMEPCPTSDDCPYGQIRQLGDQLHNILCGLQDEPIADELSNVVSMLWDVRKPETPQQREERERLEAAYDLYVTGNEYCNFPSAKSFDEFKNDGFQNDFWLTIVDKTDYRKAK